MRKGNKNQRKGLACLLALLLLLSLAGCVQSGQEPEGKVVLCHPLENGAVALIYRQTLYPEDRRKPVYLDTLCVYDQGQFTTVHTGEDFWNDGCQLVQRNGVFYYCKGSRMYSFDLIPSGWRITDLTPAPDELYALSPQADRYARRTETGVEVYDLQTGQKTAFLEGLRDISEMVWSEDGARLAVITDYRSAVTVWSPDDGSIFCYSAEEDPNVWDGWVEISGAHMAAGHRFLLVHYLWEEGMATLIWDMEANAFSDAIRTAGELVTLDVEGDALLYAVIPGSGGPQTLYRYRCSTKSSQLLDQVEGYYVAGGLMDDQGRAAVYRYQTDPPEGEPAGRLLIVS